MRTATILPFRRPRPHPCDAAQNLAAIVELQLAIVACVTAQVVLWQRVVWGGR